MCPLGGAHLGLHVERQDGQQREAVALRGEGQQAHPLVLLPLLRCGIQRQRVGPRGGGRVRFGGDRRIVPTIEPLVFFPIVAGTVLDSPR